MRIENIKMKLIEKFKMASTREKVSLLEFTLDKIKECPDLEIYIGTDSKFMWDRVKYVSAICYVYPGKGGNILIASEYDKHGLNFSERMFNGVNRSCEIAHLLYMNLDYDFFSKRVYIDINANPSEKHKSNRYYDNLISIAKSYGCKVRCKPDAWAANIVADHFMH